MEQNPNISKTSTFLASIENPNSHLTNLDVIHPKTTIHKDAVRIKLKNEYFFVLKPGDSKKYNYYLKIKKINMFIPFESDSRKINQYIQIEKLKKENIRVFVQINNKNSIKQLPVDLVFEYTINDLKTDTYVFVSNSFINLEMGSETGIILPFIPQNSKIDFFMEYEFIRELKQNDKPEPIEKKKKISRKKIKTKLFNIIVGTQYLTAHIPLMTASEIDLQLSDLRNEISNLYDKINDGNKDLS
jgi:hypothetical protein